MQDTIIIGNGTSKQIKTVSLPNSYAEFKTMAENGNLFADIKLNADGCEIVGTPLNKLNLLTDETAEKWNNANNVDEALSNVFDVVENLPIVFESEVIFEGETGNFTKSLDNFQFISVLTYPTNANDTYTTANALIPTKLIFDRLATNEAGAYFFVYTNVVKRISVNNTSVVENSFEVRIYGHNIKVVLNNG